MNDIHHLPGKAEAKAVIRQHRKASFYVKKYLMIFMGALIAAIGLELFLIPNNVIDGGIVGISIMMSSITGLSLGVFLVLLNIPFLYLGYKQIGKNFAIATTIAICILSVWSAVFAPIPKVTDDPFLAAIFGGDAVWYTPIFSEALCLVMSLLSCAATADRPICRREPRPVR